MSDLFRNTDQSRQHCEDRRIKRIAKRHLRIRLFAGSSSPPEPSGLPWADDGCAGPKGPEWFGASLKQKEDEMTLVSRFEAASRSTAELHGLLAEAFNAFAAAPRGSQERRNALQSMHNIESELATRAPGL